MNDKRAATAPPGVSSLTANAKLSIGGEEVELSLTVPDGDASPEAILPALHHFAQAVTDVAERKTRRDGKPVSCRKGCGACCRQPVPISRAEARQLAALVTGMPGDAGTELRGRFAAALERVQAAGLAAASGRLSTMDRGAKRAFARAYFDLGIACPFLENESCSIHPDRPLACREYLVTSSPVFCERLDGDHIERLPLAAPVSLAFSRMQGSGDGEESPFVLLIEALGPAGSVPAPKTKITGPEWLQRYFEELSGTPIPDPSPHI